jgi:hypothetical protein
MFTSETLLPEVHAHLATYSEFLQVRSINHLATYSEFLQVHSINHLAGFALSKIQKNIVFIEILCY